MLMQCARKTFAFASYLSPLETLKPSKGSELQRIDKAEPFLGYSVFVWSVKRERESVCGKGFKAVQWNQAKDDSWQCVRELLENTWYIQNTREILTKYSYWEYYKEVAWLISIFLWHFSNCIRLVFMKVLIKYLRKFLRYYKDAINIYAN